MKFGYRRLYIHPCLLYTSDAADDRISVDLGGRRIIKKKLNLRRKSKKRLFTESFILFILSVFLVYINYLIPNKNLLLQNLHSTFNKFFLLLIDLFSYLYEIILVIFIFVSSFTALILMVGSFNRLFKISKRKSKQIVYK